MDFNDFFKGNEYIILAILFYFLFNNERHKEYNSKIIVIYSLIISLFLLKTFNIIGMLAIFILLFFFQFEIFIDDKYKHKIICSLKDKIIDCLYLLFFKYRFGLYLLILYLIKDVNIYEIYGEDFYYIIPSILIFAYIITFISSNSFELTTYDAIMSKLKPTTFATFTALDDKKREILIEREDRTFLYRKRKYNCIDFWIILFKVRTATEIVLNSREARIHFQKQPTFKERLAKIWYYIKRQKRGHGTIEMQLYRQIAVKDGYNEEGQRKLAEIIYSQLLFKNLKKYLKRNYQIVSDERYKMFIINRYLEYAPVYIYKNTYNNYHNLFKKKKVSNCDFFIYTLGLAGKINRNNMIDDNGLIDEERFKMRYPYEIWSFGLTDSEITKSIKWFNKELSKNN